MAYVTGILLAVPVASKAAYIKLTEDAWAVFRDHGCLSIRENWGEDIPDGAVTSFPMAVQRKDDEAVVFSWMEWPDRATADAGWAAIMQDPRMAAISAMPFDGSRMMWGGFETVVDLRAGGTAKG